MLHLLWALLMSACVQGSRGCLSPGKSPKNTVKTRQVCTHGSYKDIAHIAEGLLKSTLSEASFVRLPSCTTKTAGRVNSVSFGDRSRCLQGGESMYARHHLYICDVDMFASVEISSRLFCYPSLCDEYLPNTIIPPKRLTAIFVADYDTIEYSEVFHLQKMLNLSMKSAAYTNDCNKKSMENQILDWVEMIVLTTVWEVLQNVIPVSCQTDPV